MPPHADVLQWEHLPFPTSLVDFQRLRNGNGVSEMTNLLNAGTIEQFNAILDAAQHAIIIGLCVAAAMVIYGLWREVR